MPVALPAFAAWPEHYRVLTAALAHFEADKRVPGVMLGGSFAGGRPDFYSDVDLYLIVRDGDFAAVLAEKERAAAAAGRVLTGFIPDHLGPGGDEMYIAVYDGPIHADFNYVRRSTLKPHWKLAARAVLKDADGGLEAVVRASRGLTPQPPSPESLNVIHNKFWTWCWYVFGKIARGELWEALGAVHTIRTLALVPMIAWDAGLQPEGYRRLESRADERLRGRLAMTVPSPETVSLYAALQAEIELFGEIQDRVCRRFGVAVDDAAGREISHAIHKAWQAAQAITPAPRAPRRPARRRASGRETRRRS